VTWVPGWSGYGIVGLQGNWDALNSAVTALEANRASPAPATMNVISLRTDQTVGTTWASARTLDVTFSFASHAVASAFFNSGSSARFTISLASGSGVGFEWYNLIHNANLDTSGLVMDYKGTRIGFGGAYAAGGTTAVGFFDLNTAFANLASYTRGGAYGTGGLTVQAKYDSATAVLTFRLIFNEDYAAGQSINQATVATDIRASAAAISGTPYLNSPAIAAPSVTASGTFLTAPAGT
jgi:hypothetical protein